MRALLPLLLLAAAAIVACAIVQIGDDPSLRRIGVGHREDAAPDRGTTTTTTTTSQQPAHGGGIGSEAVNAALWERVADGGRARGCTALLAEAAVPRLPRSRRRAHREYMSECRSRSSSGARTSIWLRPRTQSLGDLSRAIAAPYCWWQAYAARGYLLPFNNVRRSRSSMPMHVDVTGDVDVHAAGVRQQPRCVCAEPIGRAEPLPRGHASMQLEVGVADFRRPRSDRALRRAAHGRCPV